MKKIVFLALAILFLSMNLFANDINFLEKYGQIKPTAFGETIHGIIQDFNAHGKKLIALTFDACSGKYDKELINFLKQHNFKATLFLSGRWLDVHPKLARQLSESKLFEIENHGLMHKPLTVNGRSAYGIKGTENISEVVKEIMANAKKIYDITGIKTKFFRAGTANYDNIAIKIANDLGFQIIGFNINGDYGATAKKEVIYKNVVSAKPGSIILAHMNHPEKETYEGFKKALIYLQKKGFKFVKLEEVIKPLR
jgi:peptidoglycan/xylan/chitin deacetylase (PgdA/CDA1 family)